MGKGMHPAQPDFHAPIFPGKKDRFRGDSRGQASFAVVAVLLLTLAGTSAILASQADLEAGDVDNRRASLEEMARYIPLVSAQVEEEAYRAGIQSCQELRSLNETVLQSRFQEILVRSLATSYPSEKGGLTAEIVDQSLHLDFLRLSQGEDAMTGSGDGVVRWQMESSPAYFTINGNFSVKVSKGTGYIASDRTVERHLYLPSPLILDRLDAFERSVTGGKNRLEHMVRYELASLAQWRALSGWGASETWGEHGTTALLTDDDARRAVGMALLIIELECFGSFDRSSASEVLRDFPCPMGAEELSQMLQDRGQFDPADLFLMLNGAGEIDLRSLLAQALFAACDALVLKWLDYLQVLDLARNVEGTCVGATVLLNDMLEKVTGSDNIQQAMMEWMQGRLQESGFAEEDYRWMNYCSLDATAFIPWHSFTFRDHEGQEIVTEIGGYQELDFPSHDVLFLDSWKDFLVEYREGAFQFGDMVQGFIKAMADGITQGSEPSSARVVLDPFDGVPMMEKVGEAIEEALASEDDWFPQSLENGCGRIPSKDPLGQSLVDFISSRWQATFQMNESVDCALDRVAARMVRAALPSNGALDEQLALAYAQRVSYELKNDPMWDARGSVEEAFAINALKRVEVFTKVFSNITIQGLDGPLTEALVTLAQGAIESVPGVKEVLIETIDSMLEDSSLASGLRADFTSAVPCSSSVEIHLEGAMRATERLVPELSMGWENGQGGLWAEVILPVSSPTHDGLGGMHLTDPSNVSFAAYQSTLKVCAGGPISISLGCYGDLSDLVATVPQLRLSSDLVIGFESSLTCSSAWPLQGVDYAPSTTISGEFGKVFGRLWEGVSEGLECLAGAAGSLFDYLQELVSDLVSFAARTVQALSDLLMAIVQELRDLIDGAIGALIGWMGEGIAELAGSMALRLEIAGMSVTFDFSGLDIFLGRSKEYVKVTMSTCLLGAQLTILARFVDIYRQGPDLITNISLAGEGWMAECVIDPRMMVMDHFVEVRGLFDDIILELTVPEVVAYEKRTLRLSDIPGLGQALSRIPIPIPGMTASIDAGFEAKFNSPFATHPVINEVEMNPPGLDQGREWVEIYNPSNAPVDLAGWTIRTAHGYQEVSPVGESSIDPKSYLIVRFLGQTLDNGGESGYPLGESLSLVDAQGKKVDSIPFLTDFYNDGRTWQRTFDGSDRWEFNDSTMGAANGFLMVNFNDLEQWERALIDAVARAFAKQGGVELTLDSLAETIKAAIYEVLDTILQTIARSIVEMSLFIEVALQDYTQSCAGRIRLSLVITGEGVRDALLWVADAVRSALSNLLNPTAVAPRAHSLHEVLDDVFIRFGAFGSAGLPRLISPSCSGARFSFGANVELNLACLIAPTKGTRNWTVSFGALFEGVPGSMVRALYPVDADDLVDVWLLKATLRSVRQ
ncbi:MAG: lamin tail domain-containing protein [Methanomassiliicoccales archaeon]|nr:lamin tail domain-containing protein [Methanomassiliicoccales archaeon]